MRVSTGQIFNGGVSGIQSLQSSLYSLQNQVSTGRKLVTPQDDPVGAAQALLVSQSKSVNELFLKNQGIADTKLSTLDSVLGGVNDELQGIYEKAIAAGNGSYSDAERSFIATELEERLKNLLSLANSQDGTGRYIFGGFESATEPFSVNAPLSSALPRYSLAAGQRSVEYNGDDGIQLLQVGTNQAVATNETGSAVFMRLTDSLGNITGRSVFDGVQNMIDYLKTPSATAPVAVYSQSLGDIQSAIETVSRSRASVGARQASMETVANVANDRAVQYESQLSDIQDVDYAKALTEVTKKKLQLEAAQSTFSATSQLSLFDYI